MDFEELMAVLMAGGDDMPPTIYDDLTGAYNSRVSAGDAKISELTSAGEESAAELLRVKAHNYELLTAVPSEPESVSGEPGELNEADDDIVTFDDLISYE